MENPLAKKPSKTKYRIQLVLIIAVTVLIIGLVALGLISDHIYRTGGIRYQLIEIGSHAQSSVNAFPEARYIAWGVTEDDFGYFHDEEESLYLFYSDSSRQETRAIMHREIIRFYDDQAILILIPRNFYTFSGIRPVMFFHLLLTDGYLVSNVLYFWGQSVDANSFSMEANFYDEDRVARDIVWSFAASHVTSRANNSIPIYYGAGVGSPPAYISILGYQPDSIFPFQHNGNDYFFWYFLNPPPLFTEVFTQHFTEEVDGEVTIPALRLAYVIEAFDIQVVR